MTKKIIAAILFSALLNLIAILAAEATETIIVAVKLNEEPKGEFFVKMTADRDFLIKNEDLKDMGLQHPKGRIYTFEDKPYLSLKSIPGLIFSFNENEAVLKISAPPDLLPKKIIDFTPERQINASYPKDKSLFFNYGLNYNAGNEFMFESFTGTNQLGLRLDDFLFLSDSVFKKDDQEEKFSRLLSNITYDRRQQMDTFIFGDFYASSGNLGSTAVLGGLSYSKKYNLDPYFIKRPMLDYQGFATLPSEISVYVDGRRIKSQKVSPGGFDLRNILGYSGLHNMEVVIKDAFGREQHLTQPFYVSDGLLRKGLHEYAYQLGFLRENIGLDQDRYTSPAFYGFHRYGLTDYLTIGMRGEATKDLYNLGPLLSYSTNYGLFEFALASSQESGTKTGLAGSAAYSFQGRRFNSRLSVNSYAQDYSIITNLTDTGKPKLEISAGLGYGSNFSGSISLNFADTIKYNDEEWQTASLVYSRSIGRNVSLSFSLTQTQEWASDDRKRDLSCFMGITFYPWDQTVMSVTVHKDADKNGMTYQIAKNPPPGEGYGYRGLIDVVDQKGDVNTSVNPYFQYNGKYGIYSAEFSSRNSGDETDDSYNLSASGAVLYTGNTLAFSRPVDDSFAIVKVGQVPGVRVYENNQEVGKTDSSGKAVISNLRSYDENLIKIDDKDIPIDYSLGGVTKVISPPLRSGTLVSFDAKKVQAITGTLTMEKENQKIPVEYREIKMTMDGREIIFPTGQGGEFFIEDVVPGIFPAAFKYDGKTVTFSLIIPKSDDMIVNTGEIHVKIQD
jgi:outer membrane usher protein